MVIPYFPLIFLLLAAVPVQSQKKNGTCPEGWSWFKRSRGGWCMRVYAGSYTQEEAMARCVDVGAEVGLAGIQNREEVAFMSESLRNLTSSDTNSDIQPNIWIGTRRTKKCANKQLQEWWDNDSCMTLNSFYWTDGSATGIQGFYWEPNEPNNIGGFEHCVALRTDSGFLNDFPCYLRNVTRGYVCGRIADNMHD